MYKNDLKKNYMARLFGDEFLLFQGNRMPAEFLIKSFSKEDSIDFDLDSSTISQMLNKSYHSVESFIDYANNESFRKLSADWAWLVLDKSGK